MAGMVSLSRLLDRAKMIVVESGPANVGRWVDVERNLYEDYRRLSSSAASPRASSASR